MKYLVWGAGRNTYKFINNYFSLYFYNNPIKAIIDNDQNKWGGKFLGFPVIAPEDVKDYSFDRILMCSYYDIISKQLIEELLIAEDKIITKEELLENMYKQLWEENFIFNKKILVLGDTQRYLQIEQIYTEFLNIIGVVDYSDLDSILQYSFDYILLMNFTDIFEINNRDMCRMEAEEFLIQQVVGRGIERSKIMTDAAFSILRSRDYSTFSEREASGKAFLVFKFGGQTGLGAFVSKVASLVEYARKKEYILVVDGQSWRNQYLEEYEVGKVNAWEKFFEQPEGYTLSDIKNSKNIIIRTRGKAGKEPANLDFLCMKPELEKQVNQFKKFYLTGEKILGVLFRGTDYANRRPYEHAIQPDLMMVLETVAIKMKEWGGFDKIFLATEVEEAIQAFKEKFPDKVMYYPQQRVPAAYNEYLMMYKFNKEDDAYKRGADYWTILNILAECNSLIGGNTGGTMIAEMLNKNRYEHKFIFDLGQYGIDDRQTWNDMIV